MKKLRVVKKYKESKNDERVKKESREKELINLGK